MNKTGIKSCVSRNCIVGLLFAHCQIRCNGRGCPRMIFIRAIICHCVRQQLRNATIDEWLCDVKYRIICRAHTFAIVFDTWGTNRGQFRRELHVTDLDLAYACSAVLHILMVTSRITIYHDYFLVSLKGRKLTFSKSFLSPRFKKSDIPK